MQLSPLSVSLYLSFQSDRKIQKWEVIEDKVIVETAWQMFYLMGYAEIREGWMSCSTCDESFGNSALFDIKVVFPIVGIKCDMFVLFVRMHVEF